MLNYIEWTYEATARHSAGKQKIYRCTNWVVSPHLQNIW